MQTKKKPAKSRSKTPQVEIARDAAETPVAAAEELPTGNVRLEGQNGLVINVTKLTKSLVSDQRSKMVSSMGCISNPGGPSC